MRRRLSGEGGLPGGGLARAAALSDGPIVRLPAR